MKILNKMILKSRGSQLKKNQKTSKKQLQIFKIICKISAIRVTLPLWRRRARTTDLATGKRYVATQARGEPLAEGGFHYRNPYGTTPNYRGDLTCTGLLLQLVPFITLHRFNGFV